MAEFTDVFPDTLPAPQPLRQKESEVSNRAFSTQSVRKATASESPRGVIRGAVATRRVSRGPSGLVVIYGPNFGIICANPNGLVAAGNYAVNVDNLTIQSQ